MNGWDREYDISMGEYIELFDKSMRKEQNLILNFLKTIYQKCLVERRCLQ